MRGERACVRVCKLAVRVAVFGLPLVVCCFAYLTFTPQPRGPDLTRSRRDGRDRSVTGPCFFRFAAILLLIVCHCPKLSNFQTSVSFNASCAIPKEKGRQKAKFIPGPIGTNEQKRWLSTFHVGDRRCDHRAQRVP